jgi:hypothetical protein
MIEMNLELIFQRRTRAALSVGLFRSLGLVQLLMFYSATPLTAWQHNCQKFSGRSPTPQSGRVSDNVISAYSKSAKLETFCFELNFLI